MGKVIVANWVTLDGVMQGPGRPDEDTRDEFVHGGWAQNYADPLMAAKMNELMAGNYAWCSAGAPTRICSSHGTGKAARSKMR